MPTRIVVTPPAAEPITVEEAKTHLRVANHEEDFLIEALVAAARQHVEAMTGRALMPQTLELRLDAFPDDGEIEMPDPPLSSVASVAYVDADGVEQTVSSADYVVIRPTGPRAMPGRVVPAYGKTWPSPRCEVDAVRVRYAAGYADEDEVPAPLKAAMLLIVGDLYQNREAQSAGPAALAPNPAVEALLAPFRASWL